MQIGILESKGFSEKAIEILTSIGEINYYSGIDNIWQLLQSNGLE